MTMTTTAKTVILAVLLLPSSAAAEWPCWEFAELSSAATVPVSVMVVPDGSGDALDNAFTQDGTRMDATISLTIYDCGGVPIAGLPAEDMWLESAAQGLAGCLAGTAADAPTDAAGHTTWSGPLRGGGSDSGWCLVVINGSPLPQAPLPITFNSPDINGDRSVNLMDVPAFAADFFGGYDYRSDLHRDGIINLSDLVRMAQALGAGCP